MVSDQRVSDMGKKEKEYDRGRADGLDFALKLVKEGGQKALEEQIRIRGIFGRDYPMTHEDKVQLASNMKGLFETSMRVMIISILHSEFGFGNKRIEKFMIQYDKFLDYLDRGWLDWMDVIQQLRKENVSVEVGDMDPNFFYSPQTKYNRPDDEDIYGDDFICPEDWSRMLQDLDLTDHRDSKITSKHYLYQGGEKLYEYDGQYQQVRLYDFLDGVRYERERQMEVM